MIHIWNIVFYDPLYNALAALVHIIPGGDIGIAVILFTVIIKLILFPLSQKAVKSQIAMKEIEGDLAQIKIQYPDDKELQAKKQFELYKEKKVNPFSGCLVTLIQLPIIIALYYVFLRGLSFDSGLYGFISTPTTLSTKFFGLIDITATKSIVFAILTGLSQYFQVRFATPMSQSKSDEKGFKADLMKSMNVQMKYFLPAFIGFISYTLPVAVSLYWITSNLFMIGQELYIRKNLRDKKVLEVKATIVQ